MFLRKTQAKVLCIKKSRYLNRSQFLLGSSKEFFGAIPMNIRRKTLNNINEVDNTDFQTGNKMYRKLLFAEGSLGSFLWSVLDENL